MNGKTGNKVRNEPSILVIFGATGDLMKQKVLPAIFHLFKNGQLPLMFSILGFSNKKLTDEEFQGFVIESIKEHLGAGVQISDDFIKIFSHEYGLFDNLDYYRKLTERLGKVGGKWTVCSNRLFYMAVPPAFYQTIFKNLAASGLTDPCTAEEGWTRIMVEKPFGSNLKEVKELDDLLGKLFKEEQVYRIDHYLAKEMLQNIMVFRFANNLFERLWSKDFIERIDIKVLEDIGIEGRGEFYDGLGALSDVGQNHLLQMLALIVMENPVEMNSDSVRAKKLNVLQNIKPPRRKEVAQKTVRGQYEGFRQEEGVNKDSETETYFKIKLSLDIDKWTGVPIYLESGKKVGKAQKEVIVSFRHPVKCLCAAFGKEHVKNQVRFRLDPDPGISIKFWSKKPGPAMDLEEKWFDFAYKKTGISHTYFEEYPRVLLDAILGDQMLFTASEAATYGWQIVEPIVNAWKEDKIPLHKYNQDGGILEIAKSIK